MFKRNRAFTLAEVMIVFAVIGVLTAILVPTLFSATPDQRTLKAKKSYNTMTRTIESLVNAGSYSINDGILSSTFLTDIDAGSASNVRNRYFCNNLTESLNIVSMDCTSDKVNEAIGDSSSDCPSGSKFVVNDGDRKAVCIKKDTAEGVDRPDYDDLSTKIDTICDAYYDKVKDDKKLYNFMTSDDVRWGVQLNNFSHDAEITSHGVKIPAFYNMICFNTDDNASVDFTYGMAVRNDGKIVVGHKLHKVLQRDELNNEEE